MLRTILLVSVLIGTAFCAKKLQRGPLWDYVQAPDDSYEWTEVAEYPQNGYTTYAINLTSQTWGTEEDFTRNVWWHWLMINVPDVIRYEPEAFLYISTGSTRYEAPGPDSHSHMRWTGQYTNETGIVTAVLRQIPNQPLQDPDEILERSEDTLIAHTWMKCIQNTSDVDILLRFPMVKAVIRAMDTVQQFMSRRLYMEVDHFMVAGESKRGWTAWLVGAMDDRVRALAPVVLSCLDVIPNFHHHYQSLGGWSFAIAPYWLEGLTLWIDTPDAQRCLDVVDPIKFLEYLQMPKFVVKSVSDEFFLPDDTRYFWSQLEGPSWLWLLENSGHSINSSPLVQDYWRMMQTFYIAVIENFEIPTMTWVMDENETHGFIEVTTSVAPVAINSWSSPSISNEQRDFRLNAGTIPGPSGIVWTEGEVEDLGDNTFRAEFEIPEEGHFGFFIKAAFDGPNGRTFYQSTEINVIPDTLPFERCVGEDCLGIIV